MMTFQEFLKIELLEEELDFYKVRLRRLQTKLKEYQKVLRIAKVEGYDNFKSDVESTMKIVEKEISRCEKHLNEIYEKIIRQYT